MLCGSECRADTGVTNGILAALPPLFALALKMDQQFAEILADRPPDASKRDIDTRGHGHGEEALESHGSNGGITKARAEAAPGGGHVHGHDRLGAQSVGVELSDRPIDWAKFTAWLKGFLEKEGDFIWRFKGVLWTSAPGSGGGSKTWGWGAGRRTVVQVSLRPYGRSYNVSLYIFFYAVLMIKSIMPFLSDCEGCPTHGSIIFPPKIVGVVMKGTYYFRDREPI